MDERLRKLLAILIRRIDGLSDALGDARLTPEAWETQLARVLAAGHQAGMQLGLGTPALSDAARAWLAPQVAAQLDFLTTFRAVVERTAQFSPGLRARARLYAGAVGASYWAGQTKLLPLPALPRDGTTICKTNCGCAWRVVQLDGEGNYDCTWIRAKDDSCATCRAREQLWAPVRIRDGRLVTG